MTLCFNKAHVSPDKELALDIYMQTLGVQIGLQYESGKESLKCPDMGTHGFMKDSTKGVNDKMGGIVD